MMTARRGLAIVTVSGAIGGLLHVTERSDAAGGPRHPSLGSVAVATGPRSVNPEVHGNADQHER